MAAKRKLIKIFLIGLLNAQALPSGLFSKIHISNQQGQNKPAEFAHVLNLSIPH